MRCPRCGCDAGSPAHEVVAQVHVDDLDAAIDAGLLDVLPCHACADDCTAALVAARDGRRFALAARERFRARARRLERRAARRDAARTERAVAPVANAPSLPPAAAAALERALMRVKGKRP